MVVSCGQHEPRKPTIVRVQVKDLGGRLSDSGSLSGHITDRTNATRVDPRGSGTSCTKFGNPAAQQAAQANVQHAPTQFRPSGVGVPVRSHWACCNVAEAAGFAA